VCPSVSSWCRRRPRPCALYTARVLWGCASHAAPPLWATPARDPAAYGQRACHLRPAPHLVGDWDRVESIAEALSCARPTPRRRILRPPDLRQKAWRERGHRHPPSARDGKDAPRPGDGRGQAHRHSAHLPRLVAATARVVQVRSRAEPAVEGRCDAVGD
jgi:hypothetical protein